MTFHIFNAICQVTIYNYLEINVHNLNSAVYFFFLSHAIQVAVNKLHKWDNGFRWKQWKSMIDKASFWGSFWEKWKTRDCLTKQRFSNAIKMLMYAVLGVVLQENQDILKAENTNSQNGGQSALFNLLGGKKKQYKIVAKWRVNKVLQEWVLKLRTEVAFVSLLVPLPQS